VIEETEEPVVRIHPLEKKSVDYLVEMFQKTPEGNVRGFDVTETYRWGQGFVPEEDMDWVEEEEVAVCDPQHGWGAELDDLIAVSVEFHGEFDSEERDYIEQLCTRETEDADGLTGLEWIFGGEHDWEVDMEQILIRAPFVIDKGEEDT